MQALPLRQQRIIGIYQKGVIKLMTKLRIKGAQAGEIHHKTTAIQRVSGEMKHKAPAVTMDETTMPGVSPLAVATRKPLEQLAATKGSGWNKHNAGDLRRNDESGPIKAKPLIYIKLANTTVGRHTFKE